MIPTLEELEENMYKSQLLYIDALKQIQEPIFMKEIAGKVINNFDRMYKFFFSSDDNLENKQTNEINLTIEPYKKMYREILFKIHPDKNIGFEDKANKAFIKFTNYNSDKHISSIKYLFNYIDSDDLLDIIINFNETTTTKEQIAKLINDHWYVYYHSDTFKNLYIDKEEYEKIKILYNELEEAKNKNQMLYEELQKVRTGT